ncbi:STAS domain-containing protein [Caldimonas tepidiphila]|uniref:STAS domain-containing protein n=1 Tax=Caldimonas tepidiphila TaxID=2315841 RepID=UPI000E5ABC33|nr:STAS domain-containing protein [Caldimonas tepidiphila]
MKLDVQQREGATVVDVQAPRLDAAQAAAFRNALLDVVKDGTVSKLVLDFGKVKMIDSSGLGALVSVLKSLNGKGAILVAGANPSVLGVFKLTRLDRVFPIHESVDAAVTA